MPLDYASPSRPAVAPSKAARVSSWILSLLPVPLLVMSAAMKFMLPPQVSEGNKHLGWSDSLAMPLGVLELAILAIYLVPRTAVLGAILLTGYLGGAVATHVRVGDPFVIPVLLGVVFWLGLYLRDPRVRALIPLRGTPPVETEPSQALPAHTADRVAPATAAPQR